MHSGARPFRYPSFAPRLDKQLWNQRNDLQLRTCRVQSPALLSRVQADYGWPQREAARFRVSCWNYAEQIAEARESFHQ